MEPLHEGPRPTRAAPPPAPLRDAAGAAERAARGDRAAFAALYERYASTVHGVLLSIVGVQEAQDLVHDVFVSALRAIDGLDRPERVGAWLCAIARNRARDLLRSPARTTEALEEEPPARSEAGGDDGGEAILRHVRELPGAYRETLILRLVEGLSGPEIAERTGLTHGSVRVNLCRGMKLLRERLGAEGAS